MRGRSDLDFLLYPLATEEVPTCPECGALMTIALHEARDDRPDFSVRAMTGWCLRRTGSRFQMEKGQVY
jgi:hypothetical protein